MQLADDAKADAPPTALPANRAGGWAVQLGAFKTVDEANKVRDRLKTAGFVAFVDKVDAESGTLWRVRAGPEADRGNADKLKGRIKDKLKLDGMVVTQQWRPGMGNRKSGMGEKSRRYSMSRSSDSRFASPIPAPSMNWATIAILAVFSCPC